MSKMIEAIIAHRAAWQAFQDAPEDDDHPDTLSASHDEWQAMMELLRATPADQSDLAELKTHLDWWVVEEAQRREHEPEPFMLHAVIRLAVELGAHRAHFEIQDRARGHMSAAALYPDSVTKDAHLERATEAFACAEAIMGIGK